MGGDLNMAVKGPMADVFSDAEFMAPGSVPLWRAGGPEGDDTDCTGFLYMPRRPFHWLINKHGVHTFAHEQLGLTVRDESTHYPVFMHLWATYLLGGTRAALRSDAAQARRLLKATTKNERKRQRRRDMATIYGGGSDSKYRLSWKAADCLTHASSLPIRCLPVTRYSSRLRAKRHRTQLCALRLPG